MITIAIQAGGRSSRMGRDKALVQLAGKPLIEHVVARVRGLGDELLITTNHVEQLTYLGVPLVGDRLPGAGALHGLETALSAARGEYVLLVACDAPFVSRPLLEHLIEKRDLGDVIIPECHGRYEPLQALYRRSDCLPAVKRALRSGQRRMISFFPEVRVHAIDAAAVARLDPAGVTFFNVNTQEELEAAEEILHRLDRADR